MTTLETRPADMEDLIDASYAEWCAEKARDTKKAKKWSKIQTAYAVIFATQREGGLRK